jgi:hypothetical protein
MLAGIADDQLVVFYVYGPFTHILLKAMKLFKRKGSQDYGRKLFAGWISHWLSQKCKLDKDRQRQYYVL